MNKFSIFLLLALSFSACGGSGSSIDAGGKDILEPVKSSISLRLGQISQIDSPVAVSAALENGESIVIFDRTEGNVRQFHVVYRGPSGESLRVIFSPDGRPISAETKDAQLAFSNYTAQTVDVTLTSGSVTRKILNQQIDQESIAFLEGNTMLRVLLGLDEDIDSGTRALLAAAFSSLKIIGCFSENLLTQFQSFENFVPSLFSGVTSLICPSSLLSSISEILDSSDYKRIFVTKLSNFPECLAVSSFENEVICANKLSVENVTAARNGYVGDYPRETPRPHSSSTPEETPTPTPSVETPTPTMSPTPTPPLKSENLGRWDGVGAGSTQVTGCRNYAIKFSVGVQGSDFCQSPNVCGLAGTMDDIEDPFLDVGINGTVDEVGNFSFVGVQPSPFPITVRGDGVLNGTTGSGTFSVSNFNCTGVITLGRP